MTIDIRRATQDDMAELVALDYRNFGVAVPLGDLDKERALIDLNRFLVAMDGDQMVAVGGSFQMDLTLPGQTAVPTSGVTWVSVLASHRRRGILRRLMGGLDEMAAEFEEPTLTLTASEGPIYERFGYGIGSRNRVVEIDRRRTQIDQTLEPEPVHLVYAADHVDEMMECFDRYRLTQPGEVSRSEALFRDQNLEKNKPDFAALHPDGYAIWAVQPAWHNGHPAHELTIKDLIAVTPEAYLALWNLLLSIDLVGPIRSIRSVSADDPLPYLLTDQRALRTIEANDMLWVKVTDAVRSFGARTYRSADRLVVGVSEDYRLPTHSSRAELQRLDLSERLAIGPDGCQRTDEAVDLVATRATLGPLLVGGRASELAGGRRLSADPKTLDRADMLFGAGRMAHCRTAF